MHYSVAARAPRRRARSLTLLASLLLIVPFGASFAEAAPSGPPCTISGDGGDNTLQGTPGNDVICGLGGNDVIIPGGGDDVVDGGEGQDTLRLQGSPQGVTVDLQAGTGTGWGTQQISAVENVDGSPGPDVLKGNDGANTLSGMTGLDLIFGRQGGDTLLGGPGDDYLRGSQGNDTMDGGTGADTCDPGTGTGARTSCHRPSFTDGDDTPGLMDVKHVDTALGPVQPVWDVGTFSSWSIKKIWDRGYVLLWLDARAGPGEDHFVVVRSDGTKLKGQLWRHFEGRDSLLGGVTVANPRSSHAEIDLLLSKVKIEPGRTYYRWYIQTQYLNDGACLNVCFDRAPDADWLIQPIV